MARVMPSRVVQTIDELFPNESESQFLNADHSPQLLGILNLLNDVPDGAINPQLPGAMSQNERPQLGNAGLLQQRDCAA